MGIKRNKDQVKVVVVLGPTSSGKSDLAVYLSQKFNGEVISADSRQVYKGMDIGSGKVDEEEMQGIPHYLLDVADPNTRFSASDFKKQGEEAVQKIQEKGKLPVVCGGTAFYIRVLMGEVVVPEVSPDWKLREELDKKTLEELYQELEKVDPERAKNIDSKNKVRLIRALEIVLKTKKPVPVAEKQDKYDALYIGIEVDQKELEERIEKRLDNRIEQGLEEFGLEYRWVARYLQGKINKEKMRELLLTDIKKFSKRQRTSWRGDEKIHWIKTYKQAEKLTKNFLK